jgi:hypothetical protein
MDRTSVNVHRFSVPGLKVSIFPSRTQNPRITNPGPKDQALISNQKGGVCPLITNGMVAEWNIESKKRMMI